MPDTSARFWDRIARRYAARPVGDTAGYERTLERTRHYLKPTDAAIEFGCGSGTTAALRLSVWGATNSAPKHTKHSSPRTIGRPPWNCALPS